MTAYDYIRCELKPQRFTEMVRLGIVSVTTSTHYEIVDWARKHKKTQREVAEHFKMPVSTINYAFLRMRTEL